MPEIYLTNTLTHQKQKFDPINPDLVGIYSCGPTVYWNQHIGHMYAYTQWDVLVRFFKYIGYEVKWVMNVTDVGHMTSDEDLGEDKMEKGAKREGVSVWDIADKYLKQFKDSMSLLNINSPDVLCRATEHIEDQINLIKKIESRGFTYKTKTGLVFDTSKFPDYAKFAQLNLKEQKSGARVEVDPEKKNPWDFLLWVINQPEHSMQWDSPWGRGFPGWHIECTAMSTKYLGENFDIHTGGKEHIPVHHTNEIAQGYGAFGRTTANYWLHNDWLMLKGEKISKSLGNMITVEDLVKKGYDPLALRYLLLNSNYHKGMDFTFEALDAAENGLKNLKSQVSDLKSSSRTTLSQEKLAKVEEYRNDFINALSDDLNISKGLAILWEMLKSNLPSGDKYDLALSFDEVLGLKVGEVPQVAKVPQAIEELVQEREKLRKEGKFKEADEVRNKISDLGYMIEDSDGKTRIKSKK